MTTSHFSIYKDKAGKYRWRVKADNGEIVGASTQGFASRYRCASNANLLCTFINKSDLKIMRRTA